QGVEIDEDIGFYVDLINHEANIRRKREAIIHIAPLSASSIANERLSRQISTFNSDQHLLQRQFESLSTNSLSSTDRMQQPQ
ncbi:hypothetical protein PENTCL1PPCAC_26370, partial [Pristionchus entomophagus]